MVRFHTKNEMYINGCETIIIWNIAREIVDYYYYVRSLL